MKFIKKDWFLTLTLHSGLVLDIILILNTFQSIDHLWIFSLIIYSNESLLILLEIQLYFVFLWIIDLLLQLLFFPLLLFNHNLIELTIILYHTLSITYLNILSTWILLLMVSEHICMNWFRTINNLTLLWYISRSYFSIFQ